MKSVTVPVVIVIHWCLRRRMSINRKHFGTALTSSTFYGAITLTSRINVVIAIILERSSTVQYCSYHCNPFENKNYKFYSGYGKIAFPKTTWISFSQEILTLKWHLLSESHIMHSFYSHSVRGFLFLTTRRCLCRPFIVTLLMCLMCSLNQRHLCMWFCSFCPHVVES